MMKNLEFLTKKPIAHRGLHTKDCPENSLCAFEDAIKNGYPIEFDVQMTGDDNLVVFHDWEVSRMTEGNGMVSKMKLKELRQLKLQNTKEQISTFEEVLKLVGGQVPVVVEIKQKDIVVDKICEVVLQKLKRYEGNFAVLSFNPFVVKWFKENASYIVRGQNFTNFENSNTVMAFCKKIFLYCNWFVSNNKPDFFAIRASMIPNSYAFKRAKKDRKVILTYAVKDKKKRDRIKDMVDNEFFDNLDSGFKPEADTASPE